MLFCFLADLIWLLIIQSNEFCYTITIKSDRPFGLKHYLYTESYLKIHDFWFYVSDNKSLSAQKLDILNLVFN